MVVANTGIWYNNETVYEVEVAELLQWLHTEVGAIISSSNATSGKNLAIFLESFPQHIPTPKSSRGVLGSKIYYSVAPSVKNINEAINKSCCVPISNFSLKADWRNNIVHNLITSGNYGSVSLLPIANAFKQAHNMHTCGTEKVDCTHYCHWPLQLQFEWHILEKVVRLQCIGRQCMQGS